MNFKAWLQLQEDRKLGPPRPPKSFEQEHIEKILKNRRKPVKKRKFGATTNKKKVTVVNKNTQIDSWLKEVESLKMSLAKLKAIFDKKKFLTKDKSKEKKKVEIKKTNKALANKIKKPLDKDKESEKDDDIENAEE